MAVETVARTGRAGRQDRRIHIVGGPGSGKTSLARRLALVTDLAVHHLDDVARVGGGNGPERPPAERDALVAAILDKPAWIAEGIHLRWTDPLLRAADTIIWLDNVTWPRATRRIIGRFVHGAVGELRVRPGRNKFLRLGDYVRNLRALTGAIRESREYYGPSMSRALRGATAETRAATAEALAPYMVKVTHCRTTSDVEAIVAAAATR